jgi:hypothetical protein
MDTFNSFLFSIQEQIPSSYQWFKDDRFDAWLVVIGKQDSENVKGRLSGLFTSMWDSSTLGNASRPVLQVAREFGGVKNEQLLFASVNDNAVFFGLWWPWGDNSRISLRVGAAPA